MELTIITGLSGAGKTTALKIFEDLGYYTMDNLPSYLLEKFLELNKLQKKPVEKMAVGIDIKSYIENPNLTKDLIRIKKKNEHTEIIFLNASCEKLLIRYNEQRRPHPIGEFGDVEDGLKKEQKLLKEVKNNADFFIDTTNYNYADLKRVIENKINKSNEFIINVYSFGFKYGILQDGDMIFDVRFLPNPYYIKELKNLNGTDDLLIKYLSQFDIISTYLTEITKIVKMTLEGYKSQGKNILNIGFGCTGGKHRSVYMAEQFALLLKNEEFLVIKKHRDSLKW